MTLHVSKLRLGSGSWTSLATKVLSLFCNCSLPLVHDILCRKFDDEVLDKVTCMPEDLTSVSACFRLGQSMTLTCVSEDIFAPNLPGLLEYCTCDTFAMKIRPFSAIFGLPFFVGGGSGFVLIFPFLLWPISLQQSRIFSKRYIEYCK